MRALLLVDIQGDFLPGGALAVPRGHEIIPVVNRLMPTFELVVATKDWHPADHPSFAQRHAGKKAGDTISVSGRDQVLWPVHCVAGTPGAEFAPGLNRAAIEKAFHKGVDPEVDSYSAFFDYRGRSTGLREHLRAKGVNEIYIAGLATDYCVRATALDARRLGLEVYVIEDACRGVDLMPGDLARAFADMRAAGAKIVRSESLLQLPADRPTSSSRSALDPPCLTRKK